MSGILAQDDETPLSYQEEISAPAHDGTRLSEGVDESDNGSLTDDDSGPPSNADDGGKVLLSLLRPGRPDAGHDANTSTLVRLLRIPHEVIELYCLKPRKWLHYVATVICGVQGKLRFIGGREDITDQDMERGVTRDDHFVFHMSGEARFLDVSMRFRGNGSHTLSSRSRVVPLDLRRIYGGCPFTKMPASKCHACHIIPRLKGNEYLDLLLSFLDEPHEGITIDSHENMLIMNVLLHDSFDNDKDVAFLKTPNKFFKTNEVPGGENADPNEYRVTLHCFSTDPQTRLDLKHAAHSDLRRGSGIRQYTPEPNANEDVSHRPMDALLDLAYVYNLLMQWGSGTAKIMLKEDEGRYYPDGMDDRGRHKKGKEEEEEDAPQRKQQQNRDRDLRASKRTRTKNQEVDQNDHEVDFYDFFFTMACMSRGFTPEEFEAEQNRRRMEMEEHEAERVTGWREDVNGQQLAECDEDTEHQHSRSEDDDDEKPVSVQEALSRPPPQYATPAIPPVPPTSFSSDTDSDDSVDLMASDFTNGDKQEIKPVHRFDKRCVSHDSAFAIDGSNAEVARKRRRWISSVENAACAES